MNAIKLAYVPDITRDKWLEIRRTGIGGSDIAAIAGLHPYKTPLQVYREKLGIAPERDEDEISAELGQEMEDALARIWAKRTGKHVSKIPYILRHPEYPWALANLDRVFGDEAAPPSGILEVKLTNQDWSHALPDYVSMQGMWYMMVTGLDICVVTGAHDNKKQFFAVDIQRDKGIEKDMLAIAHDFMVRLERLDPPPATAKDNEIFDAQHPKSDGSQIVLPEGAADYIAMYDEGHLLEKRGREMKETAKARLKEIMGPAAVGVWNKCVVSWPNARPEVKFDEAAFKAAHPGLYAEFVRVQDGGRGNFAVK